LKSWQVHGEPNLAFLIGGADGVSKDVRKKASLTLSFGSISWPHMLVRGLLAEQLYRAHTLISGHPYHRVGN
jgi:23S rRNA (pseudouridine1915-N3)-methyltransferase